MFNTYPHDFIIIINAGDCDQFWTKYLTEEQEKSTTTLTRRVIGWPQFQIFFLARSFQGVRVLRLDFSYGNKVGICDIRRNSQFYHFLEVETLSITNHEIWKMVS